MNKEAIIKDMKERMEKAVTALRHELSRLRTGRATPSILEGVKVDYYGTPTPLNQLASIAVPESRLITIQPWDMSILKDVERAILASDVGLTPVNDGKVIRLAIPPLTEERRKELVKMAKRMAEDCRVAVRNIRRDANDGMKKLEKEKLLPQDDLHKSQGQIQEATDKYIARVDEMLAHKEKEIMEV